MTPRSLLHRLFHRAACLNLILVSILMGTWSAMQLMPSVIVRGDPILLYGHVGNARIHTLLGHAAFHVGTAPARFHVWVPFHERNALADLLRSGKALRIRALRSGFSSFSVVALDNGESGFGPDQLVNQGLRMGALGTVVTILWWLLCGWLLWEYLFWYRRRNWFDNNIRSTGFRDGGTTLHK